MLARFFDAMFVGGSPLVEIHLSSIVDSSVNLR